jgi:hypothetical protein
MILLLISISYIPAHVDMPTDPNHLPSRDKYHKEDA